MNSLLIWLHSLLGRHLQIQSQQNGNTDAQKLSNKHPSHWWVTLPAVILIVAIVILLITVPGIIAGPICGLLVALFGLYVFDTFKQFQADPPVIPLYKLWGRFTGAVGKTGWNIFPFRFGIDLMWGYSEIKIDQEEEDFPDMKFFTPDRVENTGHLSIAFTPIEDGPHLITYVNIGKRKGVVDKMREVVMGRLREWGPSTTEGPMGWMTAQESSEEATLVLFMSIGGWEFIGDKERQDNLRRLLNALPSKPQLVTVYKRYFGGPQNPVEKSNWGGKGMADGRPGWQKLDTGIKALSNEDRSLLDTIMDDVHHRLGKARNGQAVVPIPAWGVAINRITMATIDPPEKVVEAAQGHAIESEHKRGEQIELDFVSSKIKQLADDLHDNGDGLQKSEAIQLARLIVQLERGKTKEEIRKFVLDMNPETAEGIKSLVPLLKDMAPAFAAAAASKAGKDAGGSKK